MALTEAQILAKYDVTAPSVPDQTSSYANSAEKGILSGVTLGIAPYAGAVGHYLGSIGTADNSWQSALAQSKQDYATAEQANPTVYSAANLVGSVPAMLATGGDSYLGSVAKQGALGAVQGATSSNSVSDILPNAAEGAGINAAGAGVLGSVGVIGTALKNQLGRSTLAKALSNPDIVSRAENMFAAQGNNPDAVANWLKNETGSNSGSFSDYASNLQNKLSNKNISTSDLVSGNTSGKVYAQQFLSNVVSAAAQTQPGFIEGLVSGAKGVISSPLEQGLGGLLAGGTMFGNMPMSQAVMSAAAPVVIGAASKSAYNVGSKVAAKSVASALTPFVENPTAATGILSGIGGQVANSSGQLYNQMNPTYSPEEQAILSKYQ